MRKQFILICCILILSVTSIATAAWGHVSTYGLCGAWRFQSALEDGSAARAATIGYDLVAGNPNHGSGFTWLIGPWTDLGVASSHTLFSDNGVSQISEWGYYTVTHGITPNGGGAKVNEYTVLIDYVQTSDLGQWNALLQVDSDAHGSDAEFWTSPTGQIGVGAVGIGYSTLTYDPATWHRIVFSVDNGNFWRAYVDGILFLDAAGQAIDGRWALNEYFHLFADNTWEEVGWGLCGLVAVWDRALSTVEIANMGGWLNGSDIPTPLTFIDAESAQWDFDSSGCIDLDDLTVFTYYWLDLECTAPSWCGGSDFTMEGEVDLNDFRVFSSHWLEGCSPD